MNKNTHNHLKNQYSVRVDEYVKGLNNTTKSHTDLLIHMIKMLSIQVKFYREIHEFAKEIDVSVNTWKELQKIHTKNKTDKDNKIIHAISCDIIKLAEWYQKELKPCDSVLFEKVSKTVSKHAYQPNKAILYGGLSNIFLGLLNETIHRQADVNIKMPY